MIPPTCAIANSLPKITDFHYISIYNFNDILKILVGQEKIPFSIRRDNLYRRSTFFDAIFNSQR
jgi:hypothetical protein